MRARKRTAYGAALLHVLSAGVLTALPALACPTAADVDGPGVRFANADGESVLHTRLDPLRIVSDWTAGGGYVSRTVLIHGTYVESIVDVTNGVVERGTEGTFNRSEPPEALPVPVPGLSWTGRHIYADSRGRLEETLIITVGAAQKVLLGTCRYDVFPVAMEFVGPDDGYTEDVQYFPGLGISVLVGGRDPDGPFTYSYDRIFVEGTQ